jgi:hypothetical protein
MAPARLPRCVRQAKPRSPRLPAVPSFVPHDSLTPTGAVLLSPILFQGAPTALILLQLSVHIRCATAILWQVGAARKKSEVEKCKRFDSPKQSYTRFAILLAKLDG